MKGMAMAKMKRNKPPLTIPDISVNAGIEQWYVNQLTKLVKEMRADVQSEIIKGFRHEAKIAQDGITDYVAHAIELIAYQWEQKLDALAPEIAKEFINRTVTNYDNLMKSHLRKSGFTVRFQTTQFQRDALQASIKENVSLIKSISSQHLERVQGDVWRCVTSGYDLKGLTDSLANDYGISWRRAANIARDQSGKAHATIELARRKELGITKAIWMHSHAGKKPRPSHVKANGQIFEVDKGMYLDGEWVQPAQLPNCRCTSRSIIEGLD